jgi:hypothetical protein
MLYPKDYSCIYLNPKTYSRCENAKFEADGVELEKVVEPAASDGMGYVILNGQYLGAYHVDGLS